MKKNKNRKIIQCDESSTQDNKNEYAVKVKKEDLLFYYYVNSCMTVTLIFDEFMLGGHVSLVNKNNKKEPKKNMKMVLKKMFDYMEEKDKLKKIIYVGNNGIPEGKKDKTPIWDIGEAENIINQYFGFTDKNKLFGEAEYINTSSNIVFDLESGKYYISNWDKNQENSSTKEIVNKILLNNNTFTYNI